jgi:hypothetical protein
MRANPPGPGGRNDRSVASGLSLLVVAVALAVGAAPCLAADALCGPRCVALCARWLRVEATVRQAVELAGTDRALGSSLAGLADAVNALGLEGRCYRLSLSDLRHVTSRTPGIAHVDGNHFAVVWSEGRRVRYLNPPFDNLRLSLTNFGRRWNGAILIVSLPGEQPTWPDYRRWVALAGGLALCLGLWAAVRRRPRVIATAPGTCEPERSRPTT